MDNFFTPTNSIPPQMMKRLMELKKEKEDLALEVEREEELLTNTLQKKLNQVRRPRTQQSEALVRRRISLHTVLASPQHRSIDRSIAPCVCTPCLRQPWRDTSAAHF